MKKLVKLLKSLLFLLLVVASAPVLVLFAWITGKVQEKEIISATNSLKKHPQLQGIEEQG